MDCLLGYVQWCFTASRIARVCVLVSKQYSSGHHKYGGWPVTNLLACIIALSPLTPIYVSQQLAAVNPGPRRLHAASIES